MKTQDLLAVVDQYSQADFLDSAEAVEDYSIKNDANFDLSVTQIKNIGSGLFGNSPFSAISGMINIVEGFDRIDQSLHIIIHTLIEEVPMLPILGSRLDYLLFEQIGPVLEETLVETLSQSVGKLEPRIKLISLTTDTSRKAENIIGVDIEYQLTNTNITRKFRDTIVTENGGDIL